MRITLLCGLMVALASTAPAAVVTYRMSYHDNGFGGFTANNWAIYASVSPDAAGLVQYGIDLLPYDRGSPSVFLNRANGVVMSNPDTLETRSLGFTAGRSTDGVNGILKGAHDLQAVGLIPVYGMGQQADDLDNYIPEGFTQQDSALGGGRNPYGPQTVAGRNLFLISRGTWSGSVLPAFDTASPESIGVVWNSRSGLQTSNASLIFEYANPDPCSFGSCFSDASLRNSGVYGSNVAIGGAVAVNGTNKSYISEVDQLTSNHIAGHAPIQTIGDESGNVYVMAKLNGTQTDIAALLATLVNDVGPEDSQFTPLHAAYDGQFGLTGFNALFKFPNMEGAKVFNWDFSGHPSVTVDQLAAVPEPAGLLPVCGLLSLLRRRRL